MRRGKHERGAFRFGVLLLLRQPRQPTISIRPCTHADMKPETLAPKAGTTARYELQARALSFIMFVNATTAGAHQSLITQQQQAPLISESRAVGLSAYPLLGIRRSPHGGPF